MSINLQQNGDGSLGLQGTDYGNGEFVIESFDYTAASVDAVFFVAPRAMRIKSITWRVEAAGTDAGAVTAVVKKAASATAITAGTALHSGTANLKGAAATNQALTLSATDGDLTIPAGTAIGVDFTGVLTVASGVVTIAMCPV